VDAGLNQDLIGEYSVDPLDFIKNATGVESNNSINTTTPNTSIPASEPVAPVPVAPVPVITAPVNIPGTFSDVPYNNKFYTSISYFARQRIIK